MLGLEQNVHWYGHPLETIKGMSFSVATPNGDLKSVVVSLPWFKAEKNTNLD